MAHDMDSPSESADGGRFQRLRLNYSTSESLGPVRDDLPDLKEWIVTIVDVDVDDESEKQTPVGSVTIYQLQFPDHDNPTDTLDAHSEELAEYRVLFDSAGNPNAAVLDGGLLEPWPLTILHSVELLPEVRGRGIGSLAASRALRGLARSGLVACYPSATALPFGSGEQVIESLRIAELAIEIGFMSFRDNVYVLDAATTALDLAIRRFEDGLRR